MGRTRHTQVDAELSSLGTLFASRRGRGSLGGSVLTLPLARIIASAVALTAFAVAILAGLLVGNSADAILQRALVAMLACCVGGFLVGLVCEHVVRGELRKIDAQAKALQTADEEPEDDGTVDVVSENLDSADAAPQTASAARANSDRAAA